jgi:hypothetical protein
MAISNWKAGTLLVCIFVPSLRPQLLEPATSDVHNTLAEGVDKLSYGAGVLSLFPVFGGTTCSQLLATNHPTQGLKY